MCFFTVIFAPNISWYFFLKIDVIENCFNLRAFSNALLFSIYYGIILCIMIYLSHKLRGNHLNAFMRSRQLGIIYIIEWPTIKFNVFYRYNYAENNTFNIQRKYNKKSCELTRVRIAKNLNRLNYCTWQNIGNGKSPDRQLKLLRVDCITKMCTWEFFCRELFQNHKNPCTSDL